MLRRYLLNTLLLSLLMSFVLIVSVIASSILYYQLDLIGVPAKSDLPISLITLCLLLLVGLILLPPPFLNAFKFFRESVNFVQIGMDNLFWSVTKNMGILIAIAISGVFVIWAIIKISKLGAWGYVFYITIDPVTLILIMIIALILGIIFGIGFIKPSSVKSKNKKKRKD